MSAHVLGTRLAWGRLRSRPTLLSFGFALILIALVALFERLYERAFAVDRTLTGVVFGLCVPLYCYALFEIATGRDTLLGSITALSRQGAPRPALAAGLIATTMALAAAGSALLGVSAVMLTRGASDPRLVADAGSVAWIGALGGAGYAGAFALGSSFRRGRLWFLLADWLLGASTGFLALPWPRGHIRNLLGYSPVLDLSQRSAALALLVLIITAFLASRRLPA
jgi:hypothetical protein